eukprot:TRINITY_DN13304_c0_g1_i1.p1 TRINITY_DN13304_c0_g1~~TRINITY_DN13304_c0_g1_i1.p1  ORF type:complete len:221 (+),score=28.48 TRINITY_DN13304_c0_g1_i1:135-797(+)
MENWIRLPKVNESEEVSTVKAQLPFPPMKRQRIVRPKGSSSSSSHAENSVSDRGFKKLVCQQFVQLDTRMRQLEGAIHEALALDKEDSIVQAMKQAGREYNQQAQHRKMPSAHLFIWPAFCRAMYEANPNDGPLRQALEQHALTYTDTTKLGRVVRHCSINVSKRVPTAVLTITVKPQLEQLWDLMRMALLHNSKTAEYFGPPPRGPMPRIFQEILGQLS